MCEKGWRRKTKDAIARGGAGDQDQRDEREHPLIRWSGGRRGYSTSGASRRLDDIHHRRKKDKDIGTIGARRTERCNVATREKAGRKRGRSETRDSGMQPWKGRRCGARSWEERRESAVRDETNEERRSSGSSLWARSRERYPEVWSERKGLSREVETYIFREAIETAQCDGTDSPSSSASTGPVSFLTTAPALWDDGTNGELGGSEGGSPARTLREFSCSRASVDWWTWPLHRTARVSFSRCAVTLFSSWQRLWLLAGPTIPRMASRWTSCTCPRYATSGRRKVTSWPCTTPARCRTAASSTQGQWYLTKTRAITSREDRVIRIYWWLCVSDVWDKTILSITKSPC